MPLDHADARALIGRLRGVQLFQSYRGMPPADTDLNPVIVHARGAGISVVDAPIIKRDIRTMERQGAAE